MSPLPYSVTTMLTMKKGTVVREGTSAITITAIREGEHCNTLIEYSPLKEDELREMVAVLLCMMEDLRDEKFVASCFARYAQETGKRFLDEENGRRLVLLRG